jgi:hypothetical protein
MDQPAGWAGRPRLEKRQGAIVGEGSGAEALLEHKTAACGQQAEAHHLPAGQSSLDDFLPISLGRAGQLVLPTCHDGLRFQMLFRPVVVHADEPVQRRDRPGLGSTTWCALNRYRYWWLTGTSALFLQGLIATLVRMIWTVSSVCGVTAGAKAKSRLLKPGVVVLFVRTARPVVRDSAAGVERAITLAGDAANNCIGT